MLFINLPDEYLSLIDLLTYRLGISDIDLSVEFKESEKMCVGVKSGKGYIYCNRKNRFARLLGILVSHLDEGDFEINETPHFETLSCMMDVSFGAPLTIGSIYEYLETLALAGYNQVWFYAEDMYEIRERPYFGYMRGKYSEAELRAIDDYAFRLGIEMVACIQTLGHLQSYLCWPEANGIRENASVLLPDSDKTYEFIEKMILASRSAFRSRRIHIGCDESHGVGLGEYLKTHPYTPQFDVLISHVNRVAEICKKHGMRPMMWHDMMIALSSESYSNYDEKVCFSDKLRKALDPHLEIVFWHYGQVPGCEDYMIDKFRAIGKTPIVAGASRIWQSPLPDNYFSERVTRIAIDICKRKAVPELSITVWAYASRIYQLAYLDILRYGELAYNDNDDRLKLHFERLVGLSFDAVMRMSDLNDLYLTDKSRAEASYGGSARGSRYVNCDILLNTLRADMLKTPRSDYYRSAAEFLCPYVKRERESRGRWLFIYDFALAEFDMMRVKCEIIERLSPAYESGDRETLIDIRDRLAPELYSILERLADAHAYHRDTYLKPFGSEGNDTYYGTRLSRVRTLIRRLDHYLNGVISSIEELDEPKLEYNGGPIFPIR